MTQVQGRLRVLENNRERQFELGDGVTIGRALDNDIQILDLRSSKVHCRIVRDEDGYVLLDEGSTNGTRLNGERTTRALLHPGDLVQIGDVQIAFEGDAPSGALSAADTTVGREAVRPAPRVRDREEAGSPRRGTRRGAASGRRGGGRQPPGPARAEESADRAEEAAGEALREDLAAEAERLGAARVQELLTELVPGLPGPSYLSKLQRILAGNERLLQERSLKRLLEAILDMAVDITGAERGFIILAEGAGEGRSTIPTARNIDRESLRRPGEKISTSIAQTVLQSGQALHTSNASDDPRFSESVSVSDLKLRSILCAPIGTAGEAQGVIYVDNRFTEGAFADEDLGLLEALGHQAALALENTRLFETERRTRKELEQSQEQLERLNLELQNKLDRQRSELVELRSSIPSGRTFRYSYDNIIGSAPSMNRLFETLDRVIDSDVPVLIQGESGTGKELVARAIHFNGPRKDKAFVSENCAAISETLLESELFGHVKGAFTDAHHDKPGLFEVASGGTLFLDEIGDMSPGMQKKLLRALQEGEIRRVGGKRSINVDVRVIAASNKNLRQMIRTGEIREDLFYRLNVITVEIPPLRERREDIAPLLEHFLRRGSLEMGGVPRKLTREARDVLMRHDWPGNVRELENEIRRCCALAEEIIDLETLSPELRRKVARAAPPPPRGEEPSTVQLPEGTGLKEYVKAYAQDLERQVLEATLAEMGWHKTEVARRLSISRPTLDAKIELFGLEPPPAEEAAGRGTKR